VTRIRVSTVVDAPPDEVWADVRHIARHVEWMHDAVSITFRSDTREGVGTTFDCATRVGPLRLTDRMVVTEWHPGEAIGIRHRGAVTGSGRFTIAPEGAGTRFTWDEELTFPWWLGGPVGGLVGGPLLGVVWRRNLRNLRRRFADGQAT
jgi:hypothetical protein